MDKKYGEFVGVDSLYAAIITEDSENAYKTEIPEYFAPSSEISSESEVNNEPSYYDNVPGFNYISEGVTTITLTLSGVPADKAAKYLGKHYDLATGRVLDTGIPNPPDVALSFRFNKGPDGYRYYQYLKGNFSGGTEEASTKTDSVDVKTYEMTFTAVATTHKWSIDGEQKPLKRIFADTTDVAFNGANDWFKQVQTPDIVEAPEKLQILSSVPKDDATSIAVESDMTITFNNPVESITSTLLNTDLTVVDTTVSLDPIKKVATIRPVRLVSNAEYSLVVGKVKDIYGQTINNIVITFTTA